MYKNAETLSSKDSLWQWFSSALQWYNTLQDATNKHVNKFLTTVQHITVQINDGCVQDLTPSDNQDSNIPTPPSPPTPSQMPMLSEKED